MLVRFSVRAKRKRLFSLLLAWWKVSEGCCSNSPGFTALLLKYDLMNSPSAFLLWTDWHSLRCVDIWGTKEMAPGSRWRPSARTWLTTAPSHHLTINHKKKPVSAVSTSFVLFVHFFPSCVNKVSMYSDIQSYNVFTESMLKKTVLMFPWSIYLNFCKLSYIAWRLGSMTAWCTASALHPESLWFKSRGSKVPNAWSLHVLLW